MNPVVLKIGGSLILHADRIIDTLRQIGRPVLIVPGGGIFADLVRKVDPPDTSAHWMAIAAMDQYGWYLASFGIPVTEKLEAVTEPTIILPYRICRDLDPFPHSWNVSSDTIAAWIACKINADLIVLKSVDGIFYEGSLLKSISREDLNEGPPRVIFKTNCNTLSTLSIDSLTDTVDNYFLSFIFSHNICTLITNGTLTDRVRAAVVGSHEAEGTFISTIL
jgi:aspartokinase-like uncharacterized kinase